MSRHPESRGERGSPNAPGSGPPPDGSDSRKRVTFDDSLDIVAIPPVSEMARTLRCDCYWQDTDFQSMYKQRRMLSIEVAKLATGREKGASMSLQLANLAMKCVKESVHSLRTQREMISRPKMSRNE